MCYFSEDQGGETAEAATGVRLLREVGLGGRMRALRPKSLRPVPPKGKAPRPGNQNGPDPMVFQQNPLYKGKSLGEFKKIGKWRHTGVGNNPTVVKAGKEAANVAANKVAVAVNSAAKDASKKAWFCGQANLNAALRKRYNCDKLGAKKCSPGCIPVTAGGGRRRRRNYAKGAAGTRRRRRRRRSRRR